MGAGKYGFFACILHAMLLYFPLGTLAGLLLLVENFPASFPCGSIMYNRV